MTTVYVPSGTFSSDFNDQCSELTGVLHSLSGKHVIVGDFNFRIKEPADVNAAKFKALIEKFNLIQYVNVSTHVACWKYPWLHINLRRRVNYSYPYWSLCQLWPLCCSISFIMCFPWYCQEIFYLPEIESCWYRICTIWYIWGFHCFFSSWSQLRYWIL